MSVTIFVNDELALCALASARPACSGSKDRTHAQRRNYGRFPGLIPATTYLTQTQQRAWGWGPAQRRKQAHTHSCQLHVKRRTPQRHQEHHAQLQPDVFTFFSRSVVKISAPAARRPCTAVAAHSDSPSISLVASRDTLPTNAMVS